MTGLHNKVVDDFSSKLDLPRAIETVESIDADHMQMARCRSSDDAQYRAVVGVLKKFVRSGPLGGAGTSTWITRPPVDQTRQTGAPAVASGSALLPCYYLPILRHSRFVGRQAELDALKDLLFSQRSPSVALIGLGGMGKTQVALEVAYWAMENHPEHSIFWVPALSGATFEQAYAEIAKKLTIGKAADDEDVKESVRRHLGSAAAGSWLLVVDNADDADVVLGSLDAPGSIFQYLPESETGAVFYTTRSPDVASRAADEVELHEMSGQEATTMLEKSLKRKGLMGNEARVKELVDELTYLPLAIAQAAAYLDRNRLSVADYLTLLRGAEEDSVGAMSREFHDSTRYPRSHNAVATTWLLSFDQIRRTDEPAAELLSFISQIEPKAIPRSILPRTGSEEEMVHAVRTLCGYAFLVRRAEGDLFDMHSLVHVAARVWVDRQGRVGEAESAAMENLSAKFPTADRASRALWRHYLPHAPRVLHRSRVCRTEERYNLSFRVGRCLYEDGRFKEAIEMFEHVVAVGKRTLAEEDHSRLTSQHELARAYLSDRRIKEAIEMLEHVVVVRKTTLAEEDHSRLMSEQWLEYALHKRSKEGIPSRLMHSFAPA